MSTTYYQGFYRPANPQKYKGELPIVYRSKPELQLARFFDKNPKFIEWSSESDVIPYVHPSDGKVHRYFPDYRVTILNETTKKPEKYIVEYKPYKQTLPPTRSPNKKPTTLLREQLMYAQNMSKWSAARQYCHSKGYKFMVITEKDLPGLL